jgi:hypothetical protein
MEKSILEIKKDAFDNAIIKYKEFKKDHSKIEICDFINYIGSSSKRNILIDSIWKAKSDYILELTYDMKNYVLDKHNVQSNPLMDYSNKDLFIIHNNSIYNFNTTRFTLVGIKVDNYIKLGLSICNENDNFSRKIGRELAYNRAINGKWSIPIRMNKPVEIRNYLQTLVNDIDENIYWYKQNYI